MPPRTATKEWFRDEWADEQTRRTSPSRSNRVKAGQAIQSDQSDPVKVGQSRIKCRSWGGIRVNTTKCEFIRPVSIFINWRNPTKSNQVQPGPTLPNAEAEGSWTLLHRVIDWGAAVLYRSLKLQGDAGRLRPSIRQTCTLNTKTNHTSYAAAH